jgi:hypothetical protein
MEPEQGCDWKLTYATLAEAEDAYHRTPPRKQRPGALLPYRCEEHGGFHLGHFDTLGKRAFAAWGAETYNKVNAYGRVNRRRAHKEQVDD